MGSVFTSSAPSFAAGQPVLGSDLATLASFLSAGTSAWDDWTPTLTNLTKGSGTLISKYQQLGKNVQFLFLFTYGSGSAVGTTPTFTLPVAPNSAIYPSASGSILPSSSVIIDGGVTQREAFLAWTGTAAQILSWNAGVPASITPTAPWTWNAGDQIVVRGWYEAA